MFDERPDLEALRMQERAQTLRLGLCVIAVVLMAASLIPIANARPRLRRKETPRSPTSSAPSTP